MQKYEKNPINRQDCVDFLHSAFLAVAVIASVGDDDMVGHVYAHDVGRRLEFLCQTVVIGAWSWIVARMVVTQGYDCGVVEQCFFDDYAYVDSSFAQSSVTDAQAFYQFEVAVHQQHPRLFYIKVLHYRVHVVVYCRGRTEVFALFGFFKLSAFAQLAGGKYSDGLGGSHAVVCRQFMN